MVEGGGVWGIPPSKRGRAGWRQHVASSINGRLFKIKFACNGFLIRLTKLRIRRMCPRRSRRRRRSLPLPTHTRALSLSLSYILYGVFPLSIFFCPTTCMNVFLVFPAFLSFEPFEPFAIQLYQLLSNLFIEFQMRRRCVVVAGKLCLVLLRINN